jgi:hypothetical protein
MAVRRQGPPASTRAPKASNPHKVPHETNAHGADGKAAAKAPQIQHDRKLGKNPRERKLTFCVQPTIDILMTPIGQPTVFQHDRIETPPPGFSLRGVRHATFLSFAQPLAPPVVPLETTSELIYPDGHRSLYRS